MPEKPPTVIIKANRSLWDLEIKDFFKYKDLLYLLVRRDFVTSYKQTILGPIWVILQALMGSAVFTVVFGKIAGIDTGGHPAFLFYLVGNLAWNYFASVFGAGCNSLQSNLALFSKVYFPRLIPPIGHAVSKLINFVVQFGVYLLALAIYHSTSPSLDSGIRIEAILLPLLVLQIAILGLGLGFIISAVSVKYRDLSRFAGLATQFLMYATPVIYPISEIPKAYQFWMAWNPLTFIVESFRYLLLGSASGCTIEYALPSIGMTVMILLIGVILYNNCQRTYVDYA
jgi:lipopolysaccharide transport system permease protein